jgi:signal transduction histidine kinase
MKIGRWFQSLRNKTILSIIVFTALCAIVTGSLVYLVIQMELTSNFAADNKEATIESLAYALIPVLNSPEHPQVKPLIESNLIFEHIDYLAVFDNNGVLVASASKPGSAAADYTLESHNVTLNGRTLGRFEIGFSNQYIDVLASRTTTVLVVSVVTFLFLAGLALVIFIKRSVVQPLATLTRTISQIGPDNLSLRMNVQAQDEIGMLAASFNRMTGELETSHHALQEARNDLEQKVAARTRGERRRAEQLRAINEVGRKISAILSLDELLPYLVDSLQATFGYYHVNIFLVNLDPAGLVLKAAAGGYKNLVPLGLTLRMDAGLPGLVARQGEPLKSNDLTREPPNRVSPDFAATRSEMAVPIKIGTEILGVLDIHSLALEAFDEIDFFTVQTLSDQLAVAIENARLYQESQGLAVLEERNRLAREIHDTLAQGFTGIVLQLEAAEQSLNEDPVLAQQHLNRARALAKESLNEARRSVWALRPQKLEQLSLLAALRQEIERFSQDNAVKAGFHIVGSTPALPPEIENALLRVCQESLTNVGKHARATQVEIELAFEAAAVRLVIQDNGVGFDPDFNSENHFGLVIMRERARLVGGSIDIRSTHGTRVELTIPLHREKI